MRATFCFLFLCCLKALSRLFFRFSVEWVGHGTNGDFADARIALLLNHTSLFEPVYTAIVPWSWLWALSRRGLLPGADSTLERPLVGAVFRWMAPSVLPVSRKRDETWTEFVGRVGPDTVVLMAPEGRMRRANGLDKNGLPMTVRGGIADILARVDSGNMILLYSGGLHQIHVPGEPWPRLFRLVRARLEAVPVARYKQELDFGTPGFKLRVIEDLERRRGLHCPAPERGVAA